MKKILVIAIASLAFIQCSKEQDRFLIQKDQIGILKREHNIKQIDSVFKYDSVVRHSAQQGFVSRNTDIEIYEKGGKHLLSLSPSSTDNNSNINIVTIRDTRFKTAKNISTKSTFKDFKDNYEVSKIDRILNNINVEFKNEDFYITISVDQLPSQYKFDYTTTIDVASIPDDAKIKNMRLDWF